MADIFQKFRQWRKRNFHKFRGKPIDKVFSSIHETNHWDGVDSVSGRGSDDLQTKVIVRELPVLFEKLKIKSILDIPCGDFNWMGKVDLSGIQYIGADLVPQLISKNKEAYNASNIDFQLLDLTNDALPKVDAVFTRDCLVHFSYSDIKKALTNIITSGSKYLISTSFTDRESNYDIVTGDWRPINLEEKPFLLPNPVEAIIEECTEEDGIYADKTLLVWPVEQLKGLDFLAR